MQHKLLHWIRLEPIRLFFILEGKYQIFGDSEKLNEGYTCDFDM